MPKVSVVMPVYNGEKYLREAIDSIITQTFTDWEFIIVNEFGSSQAATDILMEYAVLDPRIKLIQNTERLRIAESLNVGLRAAQGEYIARMDADDISSPERLQKQVNYLDKHPDIDICGLKVTMFGEGVWDWRVYYGADYLHCAALFYTPFVHPTVMMRKASLQKYSLEYNPDFYYSEDFDFFVRASQKLRFDNLLDKDLYRYRFYPTNATNIGGEQGILLNQKVLKKNLADYGLVFSDEEIALLLPNSFPQAESAEELLDKLEQLDLLLKQIFLHKSVQMVFGLDTLFMVLHRVWLDAYQKNKWQEQVMSDDRVMPAIKRGLFFRERFYRSKGRLAAKKPKVSIVMPTFNSEDYILDTVYSLLEQDYSDFELLVVNEYGSNDRTVECVNLFNDPRIRILQNKKKLGLADSLNRGLQEAVGEYVARADADDVYPEDRLSKQVAFMDENPDIAVCGSWQRHFGKRNHVHMPPTLPEEMQASLLFKCEVCHSTIMLRRETFKQLNLWYDASYLSEDYELWARAAQYIKFATIPEILGEYRWNGDNITAKKMTQLDLEAQKIVARTLSNVLNMQIADEDLILLSGWQNPFCDGRSEQKELRQREDKLLKKIAEENHRLHKYDETALEAVLQQRREWAGIVKPKPVPISQPAQTKISFKQKMKNLLKKGIKPLYRPFKRRYEDRITEILDLSWSLNGRIDYLQQTAQDLDGHLWDYYTFLQRENKKQQQLITHLQAVIAAKQLQIERLMSEQENSAKEMLGQTVIDFDQHMNRRLEGLEKNINQTTDTRIWQAEQNINEKTDARIWQAEQGINEKTDARIWQAEQGINEKTDARIWQAEQGINEKTDARIWQAEQGINEKTDARIWQAEQGINEKTDARIWQAEQGINEKTDARIWKTEENLLNAVDMQAYKAVKLAPQNRLKRLTIHLVEHCNLNCQCCDNFSPVAEESYTKLNELERDFIQLEKIGGCDIGMIELSGGEALLHPQLCDFMPLARKYFKNTEINIVSNGILLPNMSDDFWQACSASDIGIIITKYPININIDLIKEKAEQYNVRWRFYEDITIKTSFFAPFDIKGGQNAERNFVNCFHANECVYLHNGRVYTCSISANLHHFNKYFNESLPDVPQNSISIYEVKSMQEILDFISRPIPLCKYCDVVGRRFNLPWGISKRKKGEWVSKIDNDEEKFELLDEQKN